MASQRLVRAGQLSMAVLLAAGVIWITGARGSAQPPSPGELAERFTRMSAEWEAKGLAEPFKGVTADGNVVPGLFAVASTGVSTEPVRKAADAFLAALTPEQRKRRPLSPSTIPSGASG